MSSIRSALDSLSATDRQRVLGWLGEFERNWAPGLLEVQARHLPPGDPWRALLLLELIRIDLRRQWQSGHALGVEAYLSHYPELGTPETVPLDLLLAEIEVRRGLGRMPGRDELARRFPSRFQELRLHFPVELAASTDTARGQSSLRSDVRVPSTGLELPEQFGRYRIERKLGQGAMGAVYLARDTRLDRVVALKVPRLNGDDPHAVERFYREARSAAGLSHPNLCPVYDVGEVDGIHYLTMAYVEGKTLAEYLEAGKPLPARNAAGVLVRLATALQFAHDNGVIHRDLKPSNVMINRQNEPVIMDFGLARRINKNEALLTRPGSVVGTPAYMAPEQAGGSVERLGPEVDIYSLGVIFYQMLTGRLPFEGDVLTVLARILTQDPPRPTALNPGLDPTLEAICLKAMARQAEARFASAGELASALKCWLSGQSVPIPPPPPAPPPSPTSFARIAALLVVVAALAGAAAWFAATQLLRKDEGGQAGPPPTTAQATQPSVATLPTRPTESLITARPTKPVEPPPPPTRPSRSTAPTRPTIEPALARMVARDIEACLELIKQGKNSTPYIKEYGPGRYEQWRRAAELGSKEAQWLVSRCYQVAAGVPLSEERAVEWLKKSAEQGFDLAQNNLGASYNAGLGVQKDPAQARIWFRKAAEQGLSIAQYNLGRNLDEGLGGPVDQPEAIKWLTRAADQDYTQAILRLGQMYHAGRGVPKPDPSKAIALYRKAAGLDMPEAMLELAKTYDLAWGVPRDAAEAARWYRMAATKGLAEAQHGLGLLLLNGDGVTKNSLEAASWMQKAVDQKTGNPQTQVVYRWNLSVAYDVLTAEADKAGDRENVLEYARKAAAINEQLRQEAPNHVPHRWRLAGNYAWIGFFWDKSKDYNRAMTWYIKASNLGDKWATNRLAQMYREGLGVGKDEEEAKRLERKAARQNSRRIKLDCPRKTGSGRGQATLWLHDFHPEGSNPIEPEERRIGEELGLELPKDVKVFLLECHETARKTDASFIEVLNRELPSSKFKDLLK